MIKLICLMNRKPGLTMEEFKAYYEDHHVPLITRLLPHTIDYRRNFAEDVQHHAGHLPDGPPTERLFDVVTELTYATEDMHQKTLDALADPEIGRIIAEDEEKFFDRTSMRVFVVDERRSTPALAPVQA